MHICPECLRECTCQGDTSAEINQDPSLQENCSHILTPDCSSGGEADEA